MLYLASTLLLSPLLLIQGKYVRWKTPKLSEPKGARAGEQGKGSEVRLLILGDSAAAGVGVNSQSQALSGRLVASLSKSVKVSWQLIALTGDNSSQVLARLKAEPVHHVDSVVISVGVNDVTGGTSLSLWSRNLLGIIKELEQTSQAQHIYFSGIPPMQHFPALPQPLRWWLGQRAKRLNAAMERVCNSHATCQYVSIAFPLEQDYIAADGFHPGGSAYTLWGNHMAKLIENSH